MVYIIPSNNLNKQYIIPLLNIHVVAAAKFWHTNPASGQETVVGQAGAARLSASTLLTPVTDTPAQAFSTCDHP